MLRKICLLSVFLAVVSWGCNLSMSKRQQQRSIAPPVSLETSRFQGIHSGVFYAGEWPCRNWWEIFCDEELNCIVENVLQKNPSMQQVLYQVEAVKQQAIIVRSKLFPLVFFDGEVTHLYSSKYGLYRALDPGFPRSASLQNLGLSFTYDFDFWHKNRNLFYAAIGRERALMAESEGVRLSLSVAAVQGYFALSADLLREKLLKELLCVTIKIEKLIEGKKKGALLSSLEVLQAKEESAFAHEAVDEIRGQIAVDRHLINVLMARSPDCPICPDQPFEPLNQRIALPCNLSSDLLARRPDLMAQIWRVQALAHEVGAARADFYPDINLAGFVGFENTGSNLARLFWGGSFTYGITPAFNLPIFTAGAIQANVQNRYADFESASFAYNDLLLKSAQEVADFIALARAIERQVQAQMQLVAYATKRVALIRARLNSGLDSQLNVLFEEQSLLEKKIQLVTLQYSQYLVVVKLIKALGGGYHVDCVPLVANTNALNVNG